MALPSQTVGTSRYSATSRKTTGSRRRPILALMVVAGIVLIAWWMLRDEPEPSETSSAQSSQASIETQHPLSRSDSLATDAASPKTPAGTPKSGDRPLHRPESTKGNAGTAAAALPVIEPGGGSADNTTPTETPAGSPATEIGTSEVDRLIARGRTAWDANRPIEARELLNHALHHPLATPTHRQQARAQLSEVSELLTFSPRVIPGDPVADVHEIQSGDLLSHITRDNNLNVDWRLIMRVNKITDPRRIRVGQRIKLLRGPFHAMVYKSAYRVDIYADARDAHGDRFYITSFPCGLGEYDSTPVGKWVVRENSKLINPRWTNPRTGETFEAEDPKNPIGERWIGIRGVDSNTESEEGYGLHGTIEPESIGQQQSMGCVRMLPADVELAYELLMPGVSEVEILP